MVRDREVLVVGGSGMLRPAVHDLLGGGARVFVVARRPQRAASGTTLDDRLVPVAADWEAPERLAASVAAAMSGEPFDEAILWVHDPPGEDLHEALGSLLAADATVVHLWGSAARDPSGGPSRPEMYAPPRSYRAVVLGFADGPSGTRWLTDREISDGALRGLEHPAELQVVGRTEPWTDRP